MTTAMEDAISAIATVVSGVAGLEMVPVNPPAVMNVHQFAIVYPERGSIDVGPIGTRRYLHDIAIDCLRLRADLATDTAALKPLVDSVPEALLAEVSSSGDVFSGKIATFASVSYEWVAWDYAKVPVYGYHFVMHDVKILVNQ